MKTLSLRQGRELTAILRTLPFICNNPPSAEAYQDAVTAEVREVGSGRSIVSGAANDTWRIEEVSMKQLYGEEAIRMAALQYARDGKTAAELFAFIKRTIKVSRREILRLAQGFGKLVHCGGGAPSS